MKICMIFQDAGCDHASMQWTPPEAEGEGKRKVVGLRHEKVTGHHKPFGYRRRGGER